MSSFNGRLLHWRELALANPWAFAASFALGAGLAFAYSYVPLHTVNNRKVERLEAAVLSKEVQIDGLARELAELREGSADAPDAEQLAALTDERDEAIRSRKLAEKEASKSKKRVRSLEGERAGWKRKIASFEAAAQRAAEVAAARTAPEVLRFEPIQADAVDAAAVADWIEPAAAAGGTSRAVAGTPPPAEVILAAPSP